jgi:5-methylcytosine-specific restriction endonuclease McrA
MSDRYRLVALGNDELLAALAGLVRRENDALSDLLAHLAELDERRVYLDLGYTSLFAYCTEALGFCKSSAGRRIAAARVCRKYPEAFARVAQGELQLSVLSVLAQHLSEANVAGLFEACSRKSYEQVETLLAVRFPKPDVRDLIRRLPAKNDARPALTIARDLPACTPDIGSKLEPGPAADSQQVVNIMEASGPQRVRDEMAPARPAQARVEPLSADRFGVHFTADAEFRELLEEVRALASHGQPRGELLPLMKRALRAYRSELQKTRFGVGRKPRRVRDANSGVAKTARRSRHVPAEVSREVYRRDDGCCSFVSRDGRRCGAKQFLEIDHVKPWAEGGPATVDNLRLRCRAHNQHSARNHFGSEHVRDAMSRARTENRSRETTRD